MFFDKTFHDGDFAHCRGDHGGNDTLVLLFFTAYGEGRTKVLTSALSPQRTVLTKPATLSAIDFSTCRFKLL